ncbi:unnamed protein product [Linum trigynum]
MTISFAATTFMMILSCYAADQKDQVCLVPPDHGLFYHDCSNQTLPSSNLQADAVAFAGKKLSQELKSNSSDACGEATFFAGADDLVGTLFYIYAGCAQGLDGGQCEDCVQDASSVVSYYCPDAAWAQAASVFCCVQYQPYPFC